MPFAFNQNWKVEKQLDKNIAKILRAFRREIQSGFPKGGLN